ETVLADQLAELRRAGDVGALADVDEVGAVGDDQRLQAAQPRMPDQGHAASSASTSCGGRRGGRPATTPAIASMCAGEVPQQPPTMLSSPASANSRSVDAICSGD